MDSLSIRPTDQTEGDSINNMVCTQEEPELPYSPITTNPYLWGELLYTICFLMVITFIRLRGKKLFDNITQLFLKRKKVELFLNDGIASNLVCLLLALFASFSILAGFLSIFTDGYFISINTLHCFIALLIFHVVLFTVVHLFGWAFNKKQIAQEIFINLLGYHISLGLLVAPFVLSSFYISHFAIATLLNIVIISFILLTIVKFLRWIEIFYAHRVSIFYMILYLCGLEIIPLLFLYKVVL